MYLRSGPSSFLYISWRKVFAKTVSIENNRSFYALSLAHHPDHNRSDPAASARFANISSAYQVLGNSAKRARYDREHGINLSSSTHSSANPGQHPMGSHSSYAANLHNKGSYAGSRPASGLSKRRGTFRGPPPSFYAHGGYGSTKGGSASRAAPGQSTSSASASASAGAKPSGGSKTEEDPTSFINSNPVWHFNAKSHFRTQSAEDIRRQRRKLREMGLDDRDIGGGGGGLSDSGGLIIRFVIVCGILLGAGAVAGFSQGRGTESSSNNTARSRPSSRQ
jgi:curved DNA-binding protein CbpA